MTFVYLNTSVCVQTYDLPSQSGVSLSLKFLFYNEL